MYSRSIWPVAGLDFVPLATFERSFVDVLHVQVLAVCLEISNLENQHIYRLEIFREMNIDE